MNRLVGILFALVLMYTCPTWGQESIDYAQSDTVAAVAAEVPEHAEPLAEEQGIDVKTVVLDHIADSYEWHICTVGEHHVTIPLLVIVRSQSGEWHCFSSSHLHAGHEYEGFRIADEGEYAGKIVEQTAEGEVVRPIDLSITKTVAGLFVNCAVLLLIVLGVARRYRNDQPDAKAKGGLAGVLEMVIDSVMEGIIIPCVGPNYRKFAPYLLTAFFFIFVNNLMGLIPIFPAGANVTGNISVTLVLAMATFFAVNVFGTRDYWKEIFWPEVPTWLKVPIPIMPAIEFIGLFTKPFSLMIRLFANILAGHAIILILTCIVFATAELGAAVNGAMSAVSVVLSIFMNCLELLVAFLQAFVFTMLSAVFIGAAQHSEEHEHETKQIENNINN
ncbi:MAG: F0F1 ATP synthase subunit A [Rikenellaceae bacterium]|nr:F0F1 ATP synthase subunit A [Rikenellaceae bacterium]